MYAKYTAVGLSGLFRALHRFIAFLYNYKQRAVTYDKYAPVRGLFLSSLSIQISRFCVRTTKEQSANIRKTHRAILRFIAFLWENNKKAKCKHPQNTSRYFAIYRVFERNLFKAFLDKHSLLRRRIARSSGDEEGSAEHQTRVRSCGCAVIFLHQRNEWHNEATSLNVREPSVSPPEGFCG